MRGRIFLFCLFFLFSISLSASAFKKENVDILFNIGKPGDFGSLGVGVKHYTDESPYGYYMNLLFPYGSEELNGEIMTEDVLQGTYNRNYLLNVGATKSIFSWFGIYGGLGLGMYKEYEGWDTSGRPAINWLSSALSSGGNGTDPDIYREKSSGYKFGLNLNAGIQLLIKKYSIEAGYNTLTGRQYIGFGMSLPGS